MNNKVNVSNCNVIKRIDEKCVDCGLCLRVCQKNNNLDNDCINCGQCVLSCPTESLIFQKNYEDVLNLINDPEKIVIVSTSPSVRVAIGDAFGFNLGSFLEGKLVSALRLLGFDYVFDTTFAADLTVMEEASELIKRIKEKKDLPQLTSCCPSWVLYMEKYHPEDLNLLSSCKSPIGMQGIMVKEYFAKLKKMDSKNIFHVALTPCVSKKSEIKRPELKGTDFVITTSELIEMIKLKNIDFETLEDGIYDEFFGKGSGGGVIFGASGGVLESALRCAYYLLHQKDAPENFFNLEAVRGKENIKEATIDMDGFFIKVLVINEVANIEKMYNSLKNYDFVEVMTCPSGCVGGAGQPRLSKMMLEKARDERQKSLYKNDYSLSLRTANHNPDIKKIYDEFLDNPLSEKSEELLHTYYEDKSCQKLSV